MATPANGCQLFAREQSVMGRVSQRGILWASATESSFTSQRIVAVFDLLQRSSVLNPAVRAACAAVVLFLPAIATGQPASPTMSDATILSPGSLRFRGGVEW